MAVGIGITITERLHAAVVNGHELVGSLLSDPEDLEACDSLQSVPAEGIVARIVDLVKRLELKEQPAYVGVGLPGIIRRGIVEDSPNLIQLKGSAIGPLLAAALEPVIGKTPVGAYNDADSVAAGIAATRGQLDRLIRVWTLGNGIGFGRYPHQEGIWEGGHAVVSLDPKEHFCGCGGKGHLEGIMGHRAMRLRFMDMEPEDIFADAKEGDARCLEFVKLWHRALAAATATSIHQSGPGKFFVTGFNARFLNLTLMGEYLNEMVKLTPLQGYHVEVVPGGQTIATIGAAVNAARAAGAQS